MSKRQRTLAAFGFIKSIKHRDRLIPVNIPNAVDEVTHDVSCSNCDKRFMNTQGQGVHKLACSKKKSVQLQPKQAQAKVPDVIAPNKIEDEAVRSTVNYLVSMVVEQHEIGSTSLMSNART